VGEVGEKCGIPPKEEGGGGGGEKNPAGGTNIKNGEWSREWKEWELLLESYGMSEC